MKSSRIGLIDGRFGDIRAVWHKEILFALARGVPVLGGASMGALRAAECARFGMQGIGGIFQDYHDGLRHRDSDVAVLHGPAETGFLPLTVALVDAEDAIDRLLRDQTICPDTASALSMAAERSHFGERSWNSILQEATVAPDLRESVIKAIKVMGPLRKARDALHLLKLLPEVQPPQHLMDMPETISFARMRISACAGPPQRLPFV